MEFIIQKVTLVNKIVSHNHLSVVTFIVFPLTFENAAIAPDHFTLAFSSSLVEFSYVLA